MSTPERRYNSTHRREQAAATRTAILEAAQRLFERDGYAAVSHLIGTIARSQLLRAQQATRRRSTANG